MITYRTLTLTVLDGGEAPAELYARTRYQYLTPVVRFVFA
jgi:hypothetical protein